MGDIIVFFHKVIFTVESRRKEKEFQMKPERKESKENYLKQAQSIPVSKINKVKNYSRVDVSGCQDLADSIHKGTQLHPIGVTPSKKQSGKYDLVYGYRRFTAIAEILKHKTIEAHIILNKDKSPLNDMQKAELNATENSTHKHPSLLEIGPAILDMAKEGKGLTTIAKVFNIPPQICGKVLTAWKIIPESIIDQVIPHKNKNEAGLSFAHLYKVASISRRSKKMNKEQIVEACDFVLNHTEPVTTSDFGKALQTFLVGGRSFDEVYTATTSEASCNHAISTKVNKKYWDNHFKKASIRQVLDATTLAVKSKDYVTAHKLASKLRKVFLLD